MRPKPQPGSPGHSSYEVYQQMLNEWIAEAMQDAADRMERAVAEWNTKQPCPRCNGTGRC